MLDRGQERDWFASWEILIEAMVAISAAWIALVQLSTSNRPLFSRHLFTNRNFATSMFFMIVIGVSTMAPMALLPPLLQQLFGYPVFSTGLMLAPRGVGVLVTMWLAGSFMGKLDARIMITVGLLMYAYSLHEMAHFSLQMDFWPVLSTGFVQGLGMGLVFMPLNSLAFATLDGQYRTDGASLLNLMRSIGQSAGISLVTVLLARNIQTSHADLAAHVTAMTLPNLDLGSLDRFGVLSDGAVMMADAALNKQAAMIAYIDDFYLMSWISVIVVPLVLLLRKPRGNVEIVLAE